MSKNNSIPIDTKMGGIFEIYNELNHGKVENPHPQYSKKGHFVKAQSDETSAKAFKLFDVFFRTPNSSKQVIMTIVSKETQLEKLKWGKFLINMAVEDPISTYHGNITLIEGENITDNLKVSFKSSESESVMSCYFISDEEDFNNSFTWNMTFESGSDIRYEDVELVINENEEWIFADDLISAGLIRR
ncbi:MAG: hypothetical protein ACRCXA_09910 [Peptostreptococcaceae bacterium]